MKNLQAGMTRPCIMDLKIGSLPYNPVKLERQRWKAEISTSGELGFRLCGLSYYERRQDDSLAEQMTELNKYACRPLKKAAMREQLMRFLCLPTGTPSLLKTALRTELEKIQTVLS